MDLPNRVVDLLLSTLNAEFATLTGAGVPIDTPMLIFPSEGLKSFDVCTGVSYPTKADRARNNPKVGLLFEGGAEEPVVAIAGMAAVRDSDIQANTTRYIHETAFARPLSPPWPHARKAVYYWSRILVAIAPARIYWWDRPSDMDRPPRTWNAPADARFPASDPKPAGAPTPPPTGLARDWREMADGALKLGLPAHLTLCDEGGFPLPFRVPRTEMTPAGFRLSVPAGAPWVRHGKASLTFIGRETFIGAARAEGADIHLTVERPLPINPFMNNPAELWDPRPETHAAMMGRLRAELARRGNQPIPNLPEEEPEPTAYAKLRQAKLGGGAAPVVPTE